MGKYSSLTIDELKKELQNCKNKPIKEKNLKKELERRYNDDVLDELLMNIEFDEPDDIKDSNIDPKYERFIIGDVANNKLLERMNSEVFLHQQQQNKKKNIELIKPYANSDSNIDRVFEKIPNNDFTNNRLIGQRKQISYN
jgi:hypothetical protein